ncbi:MAG: pilus assembly PilX N-terminal domain-containing protein [Acidobacteria bacterium]|nr:pilus assembly PilX N-terminal domain-containing protein [Acidobacteriota bacterium]
MKKFFSKSNEKGSAMVIALLVLTLLSAFVALAVTRTTNETIATSNDAAESKTFAAAQGSLEVMTRNFDKIFDQKLSPAPSDLQHVMDLLPPGFDESYNFNQDIRQTKATETVVMSGELLQGLNALRDEWQIQSTATERSSGVQVALQRKFFNNRVPIFQFGIFYDDDLEFHPGPRFDFGGRVHANGNLFLMAQTGLYFSSRVSAVGHVLTDVGRNGRPWTQWDENVWIKNGSGTYVKLTHTMGSALKNPASGNALFTNPDMPVVYRNGGWPTSKNLFQGNLLSEQRRLDLPLKIASTINGNALDYIELIKRGRAVGDLFNDGIGIAPVTTASADTIITGKERYYNKPGLRVSLADSKAKLPGCASGSGTAPISTACGVRLDGAATGDGTDAPFGQARGYLPKAMADGYQATQLNGDRIYVSGKQTWIKIEMVGFNPVDNTIQSRDVTEDILSLGLTEPAPVITVSGNTKFAIASYGNKDSRSIVKMQRWLMPGVALNSTDTNYATSYTWNGTTYNLVLADECTNSSYTTCNGIDNGTTGNFSGDYRKYAATVDDPTKFRRVVPFPIEMFDTREGLYNDDINTGTVYGSNVPKAGVMSVIDIDVTNLKNFLDGSYNLSMPAAGTLFSAANGRALRHTDVPEANGWVLYVSDRRGDADFDGEYDMEDIFGNNDGILQPGEDVNNNNSLDADYFNEAVRFTGSGTSESPASAAVLDHAFYRRAVRLINGQRLPGTYDAANPLNTKGFTVASENAIYVQGNYNATGISSVGSPTPSTNYNPQNTTAHIPASVVSDAVIILSNGWTDSRSFRYPFALSQRTATETTVRFAMLAGDARSSYENSPNQGGSDPRLTGGVHNFKRFLENWSNVRLNYSGSLINLFNSRNNNGAFKCCSKVYNPPTRNWVFDTTFLDPARLPPGTPAFQNIQLTGFQRIN